MQAHPTRLLACLAILVSAGALTGCPGGVDSDGCTPGRTLACSCGDRSGTRTCADDGVYDPCDCGEPDGGLTDGGAPCDSGLTRCEGACVDLDVDPTHCGDCVTACGDGETCEAGACVAAADCRTTPCTGLTWCDADTGTCRPGCERDDQCGGSRTCDTQSHTCVCLSWLTDCDGACVDLSTDEAHCGSCGRTCAPEAICEASTCLCPTGLDCDGVCADVAQDPAHCGRCEIACAPGEICEKGTCTPPPDCRTEGCTGLTWCDPTDGTCRPGCADDAQCGDGQVCDTSLHVCVCAPGLTHCSGACVDTTSDVAHCGTCTTSCAADELCAGGTCEAASAACDGYSDQGRLDDCAQTGTCAGASLECTVLDAVSTSACVDATPCSASPTALCCGAGEVCGTSSSPLAFGTSFCCVPGEALPGVLGPTTCVDAGLDLGCVSDADCPTDWGRPFCGRTFSPPRCVACRTDGDCASGRCDPATGACVECLSSADCAGGKVCSPTGHTCVACAADADCPASTPICSTDSVCVECTADAQCPASRPVCSNQTCEICPSGQTCQVMQDGTHACYADLGLPFPLCQEVGGPCFDAGTVCNAPTGMALNCVTPCP